MEQIIIHVDMDAFYASVEIRDNPALRGKPLIIGAMPNERGVVATCSYEARKYGVRSAMNMKDAYRLCPNGIYLRPDFEAYLDVTETAGSFAAAREIAQTIKRRTKAELGLSCSVGLAYSKTAAKTASEEKKPDGYFEILTAQDFVSLIIDRDVRALYTVGAKTAEKLARAGIHTVRDLRDRQDAVIRLLGKHGRALVRMAYGMDDRAVVPRKPENAKSISREITFQANVTDYDLLRDVLLLLALCVDERAKRCGLHGGGVVLKLTYADMRSITRSRHAENCDSPVAIYQEAVRMLDALPQKTVRLIGVGIYDLSGGEGRQLCFADILQAQEAEQEQQLRQALEQLRLRYHLDFAGNLDKIYRLQILHKTVEYMRRHKT